MVNMRKPDLMESMTLQLYAQTPIQTTAPKHMDVKGHIHKPLLTREETILSDLPSMKDATKNMDRYQNGDGVNTGDLNEEFMQVTQNNNCSKRQINNPSSLAPLPRPVNEPISSGDLLNEPDLNRSRSPYSKAECVQGWRGTSKLRKQDVSILGPDDPDIGAIGRLNPGLSLELLSNQQFLSREILQKDNWDKPGLVKNILDDTSQTNDDTILNGLNKTVLKVGRCGRTSREFGPLLHSATGRQVILPLHERCDESPHQGVSRAVQSERETAEQITRDTCHADPSGSLTAVSTERCQCLSDSPMSTYEHTAVGGAYCGTLIGIKYGTDTGY